MNEISEQSKHSPTKLGPKHKIYVCLLLAQGLSNNFVVDDLKKSFGVEIVQQTVNYYRSSRKWQKFILRLREKYLSNVLKHPLASKVNRLNFLLHGINAVIEDKETANSMGTLSALIKEARAEIEGDALTTPTIHQKIVIVSNNGQSEQAGEFIKRLTPRTEKVSQ